MWVILKIDNKKFGLLKNDFQKKTGQNFIFYKPKLKVSKYINIKLVNKKIELLGDYIFSYNKLFSEQKIINLLKFSVGLKYILNGFIPYQSEIETFIKKCKTVEDKDGFISSSLSTCKENENYQFLSGPFVKKFFKILNLKDTKIKILLGGIETYIERNKYLFYPA